MNLALTKCQSFMGIENTNSAKPKQPNTKMTKMIEDNNKKVLEHSPVVIGSMNAICWAGLGLVFDKICSKLFKLNTSTKSSLIINGIIGGCMGTYAYCQAKKLQKKSDSLETKK